MTEQTKNEISYITDVPLDKTPRHVAIIMDGNGRWAQKRGLPRIEGHRNGGSVVRETITTAARMRLQCLTLYSFSSENWKRPPDKVKGLMALYELYLIEERPTIMKYGIKVRHLGSEQGLPQNVLRELRQTVNISKNNTITRASQCR